MPNLLPLRLQAYRQMLLLGPIEDDSIQARAQLWRDTEQTISHLLTLHPSTPNQEAEILLTLLVLLQVGIRNHEPLNTTIDRTYTLLPHISDPHLKCHLLILLHLETEDDSLLPDIATLLSHSPSPATQEDHYLQQLHSLSPIYCD